jgi:hypothetical protein
LTEEEQGRYDAFLTWKRLSHSGRWSRADLSLAQQTEWDAAGITEGSWWLDLDDEEAKHVYLDVAACQYLTPN